MVAGAGGGNQPEKIGGGSKVRQEQGPEQDLIVPKSGCQETTKKWDVHVLMFK